MPAPQSMKSKIYLDLLINTIVWIIIIWNIQTNIQLLYMKRLWMEVYENT